MPRAEFTWEGVEHDLNTKSADWYWAVGIVAGALMIAAIIFGNVLLALLIIVAAVTLSLHAAKHPRRHTFSLTDRGLTIDDRLFLFEHMSSFSVFEYIDANKPPMLSIKMDSWLAPHLVIPLSDVDVDAVYAYVLDHVHEEPHHHSFTDLVAAWLGF